MNELVKLIDAELSCHLNKQIAINAMSNNKS